MTLEAPEAWLEAPEAWLKTPEARLEAPEAWVEVAKGGGGRTHGNTDEQISHIAQD